MHCQHSLLSDKYSCLQWLTAREDYHRLLTQIVLSGSRNGNSVVHYYNYVNFRAETQAAAIFDPCALAPKVRLFCLLLLACLSLETGIAVLQVAVDQGAGLCSVMHNAWSLD